MSLDEPWLGQANTLDTIKTIAILQEPETLSARRKITVPCGKYRSLTRAAQ
jgi:hypothetical protein